MMRRAWVFALVVLAIFFVAMPTRSAFADCTSPAGEESKTIYDTTGHVLTYCNGTNWITIGAGIAAGTISAFATTTCPAGWTEYVAARGRFLRGIDNGAGNDPSGTRAPSAIQADDFKSHTHGIQNTGGDNGYTGFDDDGVGVGFQTGGAWHHAGIIVTATGGTETRPKNVAVLFCQYTGAGGSGALPSTNSLDFTEFKDSMALDASTEFSVTGTKVLSITNSGTANSLVVNDQASDTTPFVIDASGNVGIGTMGPARPLDIVYSNGAGGISETGLRLENASTFNSTGIQLTSNRNWAIHAMGSGGAPAGGFTIHDYTAGAARMAINSSGHVGIGTTNPATNFHIEGSANGEVGMRLRNLSNGSGAFSILRVYNDGGGAALVLFLNSSARTADGGANGATLRNDAGNLTLAANGTVICGGTCTGFSDARLKKDVAPLVESSGLAAILQLKPVSFEWIDPRQANGAQLGFIAQDVAKVLPSLVSNSGNTSALTPDGTLTLNYNGMIAPVVKAVQELKAANDNQAEALRELREEFRAYKATHP